MFLVLFFGYLGMAMTMQINSDGASNALQAWEMLHGNVLLKDWTVTDVPFYSTELPQYALIELFYGLHEHVFRIAAAMTYAIMVILVAFLAKGGSTGREALFRMGLAVAIMVLPMPGVGYMLAFGGPNHLGTAVPLLVTWLALDRLSGVKVPVVIGILLVWGQVGDPLVMYIGVLPLALVAIYRWIRSRERLDLNLLIAAIASVVVAKGILKLVDVAGGFQAHSPPTGFANPAKWWEHIRLLGEVTLINFGGYLPDMKTPVDTGVAVIRLAGLAIAVAAVVIGLLQRDRVNQILAVAICVNCAAFIASTLPTDLLSVRQVAVVLPMAAALAGRVLKPRFEPVLAGILILFAGVFVYHAVQPARQEPKREITAWLESRDLTHGLGSYWNSNDLTLISQQRVTVAPVIGPDQIKGYRWESKAEWYDPAKHDARFIVIDTERPGFGTVEQARRQFGPPLQTRAFGQFTVLVYDKNLLEGLPAECGGWVAPSMLDCAHGPAS